MATRQISTMQDAIKAYRVIEQTREKLKEEYEAADAKFSEKVKLLEVFMLKTLRANGVQAMKISGYGTVAIVTKRRFGVADWDTFNRWVLQTGHVDLYQKRLHDSNVQTFYDETKMLPPAVNASSQDVVVVRKK